MPSCERCDFREGEIHSNPTKAAKGIRIQLQEIDGHTYCGLKCANIHKRFLQQQKEWKKATERKMRRQAQRIEENEAEMARVRTRRNIAWIRDLAGTLPVPSRNFAGKYATILALVNHWGNNRKVHLKFGDLETEREIQPFGSHSEEPIKQTVVPPLSTPFLRRLRMS